MKRASLLFPPHPLLSHPFFRSPRSPTFSPPTTFFSVFFFPHRYPAFSYPDLYSLFILFVNFNDFGLIFNHPLVVYKSHVWVFTPFPAISSGKPSWSMHNANLFTIPHFANDTHIADVGCSNTCNVAVKTNHSLWLKATLFSVQLKHFGQLMWSPSRADTN